MSPLAAIVQDQSSRSRDEKDSRSQKSSLSSTNNRAKTDDEASTDFRKRQESPSKPPLAKTVPDRAGCVLLHVDNFCCKFLCFAV